MDCAKCDTIRTYLGGYNMATGRDESQRKSLGPVLSAGFWLIALAGMPPSTAVALWLGFRDWFFPVSVAGELLGVIFFLAGLAGLAGLVGAVNIRVLWDPTLECGAPVSMPSRRHEALRWLQKMADPNWPSVLVFAGAAAGVYVDLTIVAYSYQYKPHIMWIFGILAFLCFVISCATLVALWKAEAKVWRSIKGIGISAALVVAVAQFWYLAVYIPESTQVGIQYALTVGPVVRSGSDKLVTLQFTMENESSVTALTLDSMIVVRGISYQGSSDTLTQECMKAYAEQLNTLEYPERPDQSPRYNNPDIQFGCAGISSKALAIQSPIDIDSYLFQDDMYSKDFVVAIPEPGIEALQVVIMVDYARTSRLTLGRSFAMPTGTVSIEGCRNSDAVLTSARNIQESALRIFTMGQFALYSYWCADLKNPFIAQMIAAPSKQGSAQRVPSPGTENTLESHYGPYHSTRDEIFVLSSTSPQG
jgi:hypothetical protein